MEQDEDQLRLLGIFHYIVGILTIIVLNRPSVKKLFADPPRLPGS